MRITIQRSSTVLAEQADIAEGILGRLIGLIGRRDMPTGTALILPGCRQIHTFFMRFAIDLVCADSDWRVLCTKFCIVPWRLGPYCPGAAYAIELPAGAAAGVEVGDQLKTEE